MDVKVSLKVAKIFTEIVKGEPWAEQISYHISDEYDAPNLGYDSEKRKGFFLSPPHDDDFVLAEWFAHECGHLEYNLDHPRGKFARWANRFIRVVRKSPRIPNWLYSLLLNGYYLILWRDLMNRDLYAYQVEVRLLRKVGLSLDLIKRGEAAAEAQSPPPLKRILIGWLFHRRLRKLQGGCTHDCNVVLNITPVRD